MNRATSTNITPAGTTPAGTATPSVGITQRWLRPILLTAATLLLGALLVPVSVSATPWGVLISADGKQRIALEKAVVIVGSGAKVDAVIADSTISKRHARLRHKRGVVTIEDLRSKTGTLVGGSLLRRGRKKQLFQATKLTFGAVTWTFKWLHRAKIIAPLRKSKPAPVKKTVRPAKKVKTPNLPAAKPNPRAVKHPIQRGKTRVN